MQRYDPREDPKLPRQQPCSGPSDLPVSGPFEGLGAGALVRDHSDSGRAKAAWSVAISTLVFVAWHPFNALAFNPTAVPLFLNPWFLVIVGAMGVTCGYAYVLSRSVWVPVIIHWAAVTVWVLFLGGRNLVLE
jgi:predicted Abi (CAAX) family protease